MPYVGYELTIPASKRAKTVHALDRSATVIGYRVFSRLVSRDAEFSNLSLYAIIMIQNGHVIEKTNIPCINV
jgi:hypothetical protein